MGRDADVAQAIMRNARAAWKDQLRNQVMAETPGLDASDVSARVDELVRVARSAGGRRGAAVSRRNALAARNVLEHREHLERLARDLLEQIEALADPTGDCLHQFDTGEEGDFCRRCGADAAVAA